MKRILFCLLTMIVVLCLSRSAMATLIDKGSFTYDDGAGHFGTVNLIYDDDFDITWVGDGNFAQTTGFDADGLMNWAPAVAWADGLTIGGFADWRLSTALKQDGTDPDGPGFNVTTSETGHLFYNELGGAAFNPISASSDPDLGLFPHLQDFTYWSGTELASSPTTSVWAFDFNNGRQNTVLKSSNFYSLAVRDGDVAATEPVPEPTTVVLLGIGLVGIAGAEVRRRRKKRAVDKKV